MFDQNPQVDISSLPIDQSLLQSLATEADINRHLGLAPNVPLEGATMMMSTSKLPEEEHSVGFKTPEEDFHSEGFKTDVTEAFVAAMVKKATVLVGSRRYFSWKGLGFQCGLCYSSVPTHITLTICNYLMRKEPPEVMRKDPLELLSTLGLNIGKATKTKIRPDELFVPSLLTAPSSYVNDVHHHWLSILLKVSAPVDANMLKGASLHTCFAVVDKERKLTDPWRS